jgi:hypothetical protein
MLFMKRRGMEIHTDMFILCCCINFVRCMATEITVFRKVNKFYFRLYMKYLAFDIFEKKNPTTFSTRFKYNIS